MASLVQCFGAVDLGGSYDETNPLFQAPSVIALLPHTCIRNFKTKAMSTLIRKPYFYGGIVPFLCLAAGYYKKTLEDCEQALFLSSLTSVLLLCRPVNPLFPQTLLEDHLLLVHLRWPPLDQSNFTFLSFHPCSSHSTFFSGLILLFELRYWIF